MLEKIQGLDQNTNIYKYLSYINDSIFFDYYYKTHEEIIKSTLAQKDEDAPFLSVIIRTQGKREDGLREALLCVSAQENTDYEVILIAHNAGKNKGVIKEIIDEQQDWFKEKIRYIEIDEGTRTLPLNVGFSMAKGKYASIFDDDDILFENWVTAFFEASKENSGKILHSYAYQQMWRINQDKSYQSIASPDPVYFRRFDMLEQLTVNRCPLMTLAFPVKMFQRFGVTFDENLNVTEDWEYLMRVSLLVGVYDTEVPVTIYRFWENTETSATAHSQEEWNETFKIIQKKLIEGGVYLQAGDALRIIEARSGNPEIGNPGVMMSKMFYSLNNAFSDRQLLFAYSDCDLPHFNYWFSFKGVEGIVTALRFDLWDEGMFVMKSLNIEVYYTNGDVEKISSKQCVSTGIEHKGNYIFLHKYPEVVCELKNRERVDCVHVSGVVTRELDDFKLESFLLRATKLLMKRRLHRKGLY